MQEVKLCGTADCEQWPRQVNYLTPADSALMTVPEAASWATEYLHKSVTNSNIAYLIAYAHIKRYDDGGVVKVSGKELKHYYEQHSKYTSERWGRGQADNGRQEHSDGLNWALSFDTYTEAETTKHVHRLHPYKGKFIPQLVEYFLDEHTDRFKREVCFHAGDIVLDPFCGSGTTLVQSAELGINAIGIDVSLFNMLISNCKVDRIDIMNLIHTVDLLTQGLRDFYGKTNMASFEAELVERLNAFNNKYFSSYEYKRAIRSRALDEKSYSRERVAEFMPTYDELVQRYSVSLETDASSFINKWFLPSVRGELYFLRGMVNDVADKKVRRMLMLILSRTMRSCRATTHSDLATLVEPVKTPYYCAKHYKVCRPIYTITKWWGTYSQDTINRLMQFDKLRTNALQVCVTGDSRNIDLIDALSKRNRALCDLVQRQKIQGIFSSPPYVGLIDYHEQHAYAYELFGFPRNDSSEIGPLSSGQTLAARDKYVEDIAAVLLNCKKYLCEDYNVFLVANDKYNLYPRIADIAGMQIVEQFKRPVLNRTERAKNAYSETIFHLKERGNGNG